MSGSDDRGGSRTIKWAEVVGGGVLGLMGGWLLFAMAGIILYANGWDLVGTREEVIVGLVALLIIPVCAGAVLIHRGRRQLGSGMLLGVTIGSIIGAGVCSAVALFP